MNRTKKCLTKWAAMILAVAVAIAWSPASRAEEGPAATQPAATTPPTADQRLEELEKEVTLLQQEITALKNDNTPGMKTAALTEPAAGGGSAATGALSPTSGDDAPPKISIASLLGPITLSGFGDAYYSYDNNHPFNNQAGLRFFEAPTNGFNFNLAELILDKAPDATSAESRLGYHVSAGYGEAAKVVNGSDNTGFGDGSNFFVKEAYASYLAPVGKGLTITVGKFVTNAGAEVIESQSNWNYSHSLLFYYAIPFFHFGAKAAYTFNPKWSVNASVVNGWNNTFINHQAGIGSSSGLTYGATVAYTPNMKWSATENYYAGPVTDAIGLGGQTLSDWKQLSDTVIGYTPNTKWAFQLNGDYGFGPRSYTGTCADAKVSSPEPEGGTTPTCTAKPAVDWWGVAGYAKYTRSPKTNFAVRYEYYDDPEGYTGVTSFGDHVWAQEVTGTYSYNLTSALLIRGEYRYDFASLPIFEQSLSNDKFVKEQNTATISFVYAFSSANLK